MRGRRRAQNEGGPSQLRWTLIERAIERGDAVFDFGRSTDVGSTYRFKAGFGAKPRRCYWHYVVPRGGEPPALRPDNPKVKLAVRVWQRLPVALTRLLGPPVRRSQPCRNLVE